MVKKAIFILAVALVFSVFYSLFASHVGAAGLGVAPSRVVIEDAVAGDEYQRQITIFNMGTEPLTGSLSAGGDAASWLSFHEMGGAPIDTINLPSGEVRFVVKVNVPGDATKGEHKAAVSMQPQGQGSLVVGLEVGVTIQVVEGAEGGEATPAAPAEATPAPGEGTPAAPPGGDTPTAPEGGTPAALVEDAADHSGSISTGLIVAIAVGAVCVLAMGVVVYRSRRT